MDIETPDFLGGEPTPEPTPAPEPAPSPAPAAPAPASPAPPAPEPAPAAAVVDPATGHVVPLATFLDARDRANAAEKRAKDLQEWRDQQEAAARRQPPPNRDEDPDGYEAHQRGQFQAAIYSERLNNSRAINELRHGEDVVKAAFDWGVQRCDQDPHFNAKVRASPDPVGAVVAEWRREQVTSKIDPTDIAGYLAWKATQAGAPAAAPAAPPVAPAAPRASLAAGPSAGKSADVEALDGAGTYSAMFG